MHVTETDEVGCEVCYYCHLGMPSRWGKLRAQCIIRHDSLCDSLRERGTRGNALFLASSLGGVDCSALAEISKGTTLYIYQGTKGLLHMSLLHL